MIPSKTLIIAVFIPICVPVKAGPGMDWGTCCMQAAREQVSETNLQEPWDACGVDPDFDFENPSPSPSVNTTLGWCIHHCPGYQKSSAEQWLQPLATWIIPALTLLILCSVGEHGKSKHEKWPFYTLCYNVKEYIAILGDPASAICGAFSELFMDALMMKRLNKADDTFAQVVIGIAILASHTEFCGWDSGYIFTFELNEMEKQDAGDSPLEGSRSRNELTKRVRAAFKDRDFASSLQSGIRTILKARVSFVNGVIVPIVLLLVSTGSSFHDAYLKLGANDLAHGLAYGIWYSWLIILAVVSNSYVASVNPGFTKEVIGRLVDLDRRTVPLRMRVTTAYDWTQWVRTIVDEQPWVPHRHRPTFFYLGHLGGQTMAWVCVAYVCSCAAAISYNTPTIGIGCRSFSFLLYGVLSIIIAWLMVLQAWAASRNAQKGGHPSQIAKLLRLLYICLTFLNAFVLIFSTIAQLIGLFRSCICTHFGPLSTVVELSTGTELSIHNAKVTWMPLGFVSYAGVWLVCATAIGFRTFNYTRIKKLIG